MATVATAAPDPRQPAPDSIITLLSSADMLRSKVGTVLAVMGQCMPMILDTSGEFESKTLKAQYDGGCADSAQVTYIKACARLDALLDGEGNWKIHELDDLTGERTKELHEINVKLAKLQLERAEFFNRPSVMAGAKVYRAGDTFYAVIGDGGSPNAVQAKGATVAEALKNLDDILTSVVRPEPVRKPRKKI